jgi:hypothetical protein
VQSSNRLFLNAPFRRSTFSEIRCHSFLALVYHTAGLSAKASEEVGQLASLRDPLSPEDEATVKVATKARVDQLRRIDESFLRLKKRTKGGWVE